MKFIPAILTESVEELRLQIDRLLPYFDRISIDIEDGKFTSTMTCQIETLVMEKEKWIDDKMKNVTFDVDLMMDDWEAGVNLLTQLNSSIKLKNVFLHYQTLKNKPYPIDKNYPFAIGLAIDPEDEIEDIEHNIDLNRVNTIQIMTVHSGSQGQPLILNSLNKVGILKQKNYRQEIGIDGGVNEQTLQVIFNQNPTPDFVCVGSYLSTAGNDLSQRIQNLKLLENQARVKEE